MRPINWWKGPFFFRAPTIRTDSALCAQTKNWTTLWISLKLDLPYKCIVKLSFPRNGMSGNALSKVLHYVGTFCSFK